MSKKLEVAITGSEYIIEVFQNKLGNQAHIKIFNINAVPPGADLLIIADIESHPQLLSKLAELNIPLLVGLNQITLRELLQGFGQLNISIAGFNSLPLFLESDPLECCLAEPSEKEKFVKLFASLGLKSLWVDDRIGFVSPRILMMIINEAYYTVQEGSAGKTEIDIAMKLGTAYPFGPFEACERIGITNVYSTLQAIYNDTKEARYKICPLLKQEYLRAL